MTDPYAQLCTFYAGLEHHEDAARRVAWRALDDQVLRLEVLLDAIEHGDYPISILDVGCGVGTLYGLLAATGRLGGYLGIDLLPAMIETARRNHPAGRFLEADLLTLEGTETFDLVVCSGALNVKVGDHERWVVRMLRAMWQRARLALAVNFQWTRAYTTNPRSAGDPDIFHAKRSTLLDWCEQLTPWLAMRQDYLGDDVAFYLYKDYHRTVRRMGDDCRFDERSEEDRACGRAFLLLERGMPGAALEVLDGHEETARVLNFRGLCHHRLGDLRAARGFYERALRLDPNLEAARLNLDWIEKRLGERAGV